MNCILTTHTLKHVFHYGHLFSRVTLGKANTYKLSPLLEENVTPKVGQSRVRMEVGGHLPAIHRSPTTIIFLRITTLLTIILEKVRKGGK